MKTNFFLTTEGIALSTIIILSIMYIVFLYAHFPEKKYILTGKLPVSHFKNKYWYNLELILTEGCKGEIIVWDKNNESIEVLLKKLKKYENFIVLTDKDIALIEEQTILKIKK